MDELPDIRPTLAAYIRDQASWRFEKAAEYPEDLRNERSAESLSMLAQFVEDLPAQDEILGGLAIVQASYHADVYLPGEAARYVIARFGFHRVETDFRVFLDHLLSVEVSGVRGAIETELDGPE
jgi:hypothetical protein